MNEDTADSNIRLTEFDYQLSSPQLQMMKAAIPYMQLPQQRAFSMIIRMQEMRRTMELFRDGELSAMGLRAPGSAGTSPMEMLQAMKPYAGPRERDMIETLENIQIMIQAMQTQSGV